MKLNRAVVLGLMLIGGNVHSAIITSFSNLQIGSNFYDVTIRQGSFNSIWDADGDLTFGNDASLLNRTPVVLGGPHRSGSSA